MARIFARMGIALAALVLSAQAAAALVTAPTYLTPSGVPAAAIGIVCINPDLSSCTFGGGGGGASYTAAAAPFAVTAGINKPAFIDTANSAQGVELCVPGTTTCVDPTAPAALVGQDGSTKMASTNPLAAAVYPSGGTVPLVQATASVPISFTAAGGPTQIIPASGSTKIYITHYHLVTSGAGTWAWVAGTGVNCGTGTHYLEGAAGHPLSFSANGGLSAGSGLGPILVTGAGEAACAIYTGAVDSSGSAAFAQF